MKTIIIDDEWLIRAELIELLKQHKKINVVGEAVNVSEAMTLINDKKPDLIFLDICMKEEEGFDRLIEANREYKTVCLSVLDETVIKNEENNIVAYLLKPINEKKLFDIVDKL
jgi:two-component system LytT family response regulator